MKTLIMVIHITIEYGYPHSNALFNIYSSKAQYFAPNVSFISNVKPLCQPITSDITCGIGVKKVYRRIYWRKFLTLSNQMSGYIRKCIRIPCLSLDTIIDHRTELRPLMIHDFCQNFIPLSIFRMKIEFDQMILTRSKLGLLCVNFRTFITVSWERIDKIGPNFAYASIYWQDLG